MIQTLKQNGKTLWFLAALMLAMLAIPASAQVQLLHPTNSIWRYQTNWAAQQEAAGEWVNPGFDDSAWPEGKGLFGNDSGYPYRMNTSDGHGSGLPIAIYYRSRFSWSGSMAGVVLTGTNYVDDGGIIYLNGVEIARFNMAADANAATPYAQAPTANPGGYPNVNFGEPVLVRLEIALGSLTNGSPNPLVVGDNVVAVQVHQSGTASSDRVFGLALYGGYIEPCFVDDTQLTNRVILRGRSTTFLVSGSCVPAPTFQWYRNVGQGEELIVGATGASYTLTNARLILDSGQYYVKATHPTGTQISRQATLRVDHDDIWPNLVSARLGADTFEVIARVDEPLCTDFEVCGTDSLSRFNWEIVNADNPMESLVINSIAMNSLNVIFTLDGSTPWKLDTRYIVRAANLGGQTGIGDLYGNPMAVGSSATTPPAASAISVKWPFGSDLYTFDVAPSQFEFSTFVWPGTANGASTVATLDAAVQALDASLSNQRLPEALGNPPGNSGTARYASDTKNLITRPAGVIGNVIVAHLRNDTGSAQDSLAVTYTLTDRNPFTSEEIAGHLVYYSFSGAPNTWSPLYGLYTNGVSGSKTGFLDVERTPWPAGADMYILFADDNAVGAEGIYEIDNFHVRAGHIDPPPDTNQPALVRAIGPADTTILLTFSERMAASAGTTAPYSVSGATVIAASLNSAGDEVTLVTTPRPVGNAIVTITGLYDNSAQANLIAPNPVTFNLTTVQKVVNWNASWEYNTNNLDAVPDWTTTGGTGWLTGNGFFGTETSTATLAALPVPIATPIPPPVPDLTQSFLTSYYRKSILLPALAAGQSYALGFYADDGAVFHLDGVELGRFNMPAGPVRYSTNAVAFVEAAPLALPFTATAGNHVLAVEVHQNANTSSDALFGASVIVIPTAAPSLSVVHSGTNAVVSWNADSSWMLVGSTSITGPYVPVAGAGLRSFSRPIATSATQFYKLNYVPQP